MSFIDGGNPSDPGGAGGGQDDPFEGLSDFGKQFLENQVQDPEQRVAFAPHVKAWDKGANTRFQEIHNQYRPYRDLGDIETVKQQLNFVNRFNADPEGTLKLLLDHEVLSQSQLQNLLGIKAPPVQNDGNQSDEERIQALLDARLGPLEKTTGALAQTFTQSQQQAQQQQAMAQLDKAVSDLKTKYGDDFHEDLTLAMAAQMNIDLEQAHKIVSEKVNGVVQKRIPPRAGYTMPGSGSGASFNKQPADLSDEATRRAYIADRLIQMNNQR